MPSAHPQELTFKEGKRLLDQIAAFGDPMPHLVLTGGDPLQRHRLFELIAYGVRLGMKVSITPAATPRLTREVLAELKDAGIDSIALSLDGSSAASHDAIRQVPDCFERTIQAAKWAGEVGLPLQINTLVAEETEGDLAAIFALLHQFPLMRWSLFFLIAIGRGAQLNQMQPDDGEKLMRWIHQLAKRAPFQIKTTEAPSYRRVAREEMIAAGITPDQMRDTSVHCGHGIRDGNGVVFISHLGEVYPSGFLPLCAGNVQLQSLAEIYRESAVFRNVRDVNHFEGKRGVCEYR
jgi:MoaA/NifB/PqqE/SkfB family radical SAM enzyme